METTQQILQYNRKKLKDLQTQKEEIAQEITERATLIEIIERGMQQQSTVMLTTGFI